MSLWLHLSEQISLQTQQNFQVKQHPSLGGGCINSAYKISDGKTNYFLKLNHRHHGDMFKSEALSLEELARPGLIRIPKVICYGETGDQSYLVLEYLDLSGNLNNEMFGQQLAAMHNISSNTYGWHIDNTIGSTPQYNHASDNWVEFWRYQRLLPQMQLAERNGYAGALSPVMDKLLDNFQKLFTSYQPQASMLHGDLWGGNAAALADGTPVIFDPAFYFGDREADIAMTYLFGGFNQNFYAAYNEAWPLDSGFAVRKTFYNLYHIINHLNLFGTGYLGQAISMAEQVLAEI